MVFDDTFTELALLLGAQNVGATVEVLAPDQTNSHDLFYPPYYMARQAQAAQWPAASLLILAAAVELFMWITIYKQFVVPKAHLQHDRIPRHRPNKWIHVA